MRYRPVRVHLHLRLCVCACVCVHVRIYIYIHTYTYIYKYKHTHTHTHTHEYTGIWSPFIILFFYSYLHPGLGSLDQGIGALFSLLIFFSYRGLGSLDKCLGAFFDVIVPQVHLPPQKKRIERNKFQVCNFLFSLLEKKAHREEI